MMQASPPSASQVLDAAQRAEAEGRLDYAMEFYQHLSDHHREAPEAVAAREALARMTRPRPVASTAVRREASARPAARRPERGQQPRDPGRDNAHVAPDGRHKAPLKIAPAGIADQRRALVVPEPVSAYLAGRVIAHGLTGAGVLLAILGAASGVAHVLAPEAVAAVPFAPDFLTSPAVGPVAIAGGLALILAGQVARALFDAAAAARELVAIERAKAEHLAQSLR